MESEYISMKEEDFPKEREELKQVIQILQGIIKKLKEELDSAYHNLGKAEKKIKKLHGKNDDLHEYNKKLGKQLHKERKPPRMHDASSQTKNDIPSSNIGVTETPNIGNNGDQLPSMKEIAPAWPSTDAEHGVSLADSLKAAAEEALEETGVVFDDNSGMYYDYNTGYYFDPDRSLYYEPHSGTYYYYNSATGKYEFHSQIDVNQYTSKSSKKKKKSRDIDADQSDKPRQMDKREKRETEKPKGRKRSIGDKEEKEEDKKKLRKKEKKEKKKSKTSSKTDSSSSNRESVTATGSETEKKSSEKRSSEKKGVTTKLVNKDGDAQKDVQTGSKEEGEEISDVEEEVKVDAKVEGEDEGECTEQEESGHDSEMEEGELSDSGSSSDSSGEEESNESTPEEEETVEETSALYYPPCIRAMVTASDSLDVGTLFLVTLTGATIGRDENLAHGILIPDEQVSKMHSAITYSEEHRRYIIKDHASQNGTFVNDFRISESKVMSETFTLSNLDVIRVGGTSLKLHIHPGQETCDDCEPGIVQAKLHAEQLKETRVSSKEDKEKQRRKALNQIKKKYGLKEASYVDEGGSSVKDGYEDKAAIRRKTKGSDNPYQKDDMPASVNKAIPAQNKGHQLLAKMGWKEGSGLGRTEQGRAEPVQAFLRSKQSAGLGSSGSLEHSLDAQPQQVKHSERWLKAQERFMALTGVQDDEEDEDVVPGTTAVVKPAAAAVAKQAIAKPAPAKKTITFIQGQTLVQDTDQADLNKGEDKT